MDDNDDKGNANVEADEHIGALLSLLGMERLRRRTAEARVNAIDSTRTRDRKMLASALYEFGTALEILKRHRYKMNKSDSDCVGLLVDRHERLVGGYPLDEVSA